MAKVTEKKLVSFDWAVKRLLRSKANFEVLEGFLSELLFDDIKILEVLESESNKDNERDKYNRVDIKVKNAKGELLIIEVQVNNEIDFFHRILFATSKAICEHLDEGDEYSKVVKVISINILYFDLGEGNDYIYKGKTQFRSFHDHEELLKLSKNQMEKFNKVYPGDIYPEYYIIKVNNFDDVAKSTLDEWIYLFKNSAIKSNFKAKGIKKAGRVLDKLRMTKEERQAYDDYIDTRRYNKGVFETALGDKIRKLEDEHSKELKKIDDKLKERDSQLQERDSQLQERDSQLQERDSQLQEKDSQLQEKDSQLQEKDSQLQEKDSQLQEKDSQLQEEKNKLQALAKLLLENGVSKEQILAQTGIKL